MREADREGGAMLTIGAFRRKMENIAWVNHLTAYPVGNVFPEAAADF